MGQANLITGIIIGGACVLTSLMAMAFGLRMPAVVYRSAAAAIAAVALISGPIFLTLLWLLGRNPTPSHAMRRGLVCGYVGSLALWSVVSAIH